MILTAQEYLKHCYTFPKLPLPNKNFSADFFSVLERREQFEKFIKSRINCRPAFI